MRTLLVAAGVASLSLMSMPALANGPAAPAWKSVDLPHSQQSLRGLSAVSADVAWVSGDEGGVWRTKDGGVTWKDVRPDTGDKVLLFRDVEAVSAAEAQVLAIGPRGQSRIYQTADGGKTWTMSFQNTEKRAFYDCFSMFDDGMHGLAMSDPVNGKFRVIRTEDGGATWTKVPSAGMPKAKDGEFGFAASGTCLVTHGDQDAWIATGGTASRVFHSADGGLTWSAARSTIPASPAGGVFSLAFKSPTVGVAVGGDFEVEDNGVDMSAVSSDGGGTWTNAGDLSGYRSGAAFIPGSGKTVVAVGPSGSDLSTDGGLTWKAFSDLSLHAVDCTAEGDCWASGYDGAVAVLQR